MPESPSTSHHVYGWYVYHPQMVVVYDIGFPTLPGFTVVLQVLFTFFILSFPVFFKQTHKLIWVMT